MDLFSHPRFEKLQHDAQKCEKCPEMCKRTKVLSWGNGRPSATVMFVAEAPGRLGAEVTSVPLHGDRAGDNFELLLETAGIDRSEIFVTNAVLCNPQDSSGNNRSPKKEEILNCSDWLRQQIEVVNPKVVVSLGAVALKALDLVSEHNLNLSDAVRTAVKWNDRILVPLYHPGQRAMLHRSLANQRADYYFVAETARRLGFASKSTGRSSRAISQSGKKAVQLIVEAMGEVSLFQMHKFLYLLDYYHYRAFGTKITGFHYIRQKDGPYCVDIAGQLGKNIDGVKVRKAPNGVVFQVESGGLFRKSDEISEFPFLKTVLEKYGSLSHAELKTSVYLTRPMKDILRLEKTGNSMLNAPLLAA